VKLKVIAATVIVTALLAIAAFAAVTSYAVVSTSKPARLAAPPNPLAHVTRVLYRPPGLARAQQVPVLVYHEMNNGCAPTAPVCKSRDAQSVSLAQFRAEMASMYSSGYHTVTIQQYLKWLADPGTPLPSKPFLITVDNGIADFLEGAEPVLYHYRYTAVPFLVTGFADGASGHCTPRYNGISIQPGCPAVNDRGWDLTWAQIEALPGAVYPSFGIEAGTSGYYVQVYNPACWDYIACKMPGESTAAYTRRVLLEYDYGIDEMTEHLGARFDAGAWVVPYSDLGYPCAPSGCAPQHYTGQSGWLISFAALNFKAAFVQDAYRNGVSHERFRYEVHGTDTLKDFETAIRGYLAARAWKES
jgi:hypothetical protein